VTIIVCVEEAHNCVSFITADADSDLLKTRVKFISVNLVVAVKGVKISESSSKASDGLSTSGLDLSFNSLKDYTFYVIR
jgi:hypothetical protein